MIPFCALFSHKISDKIAFDTRQPFAVSATRSPKKRTKPPFSYRFICCICWGYSHLQGMPSNNRSPNMIRSSCMQGFSSSITIGCVSASQNACKSDGTKTAFPHNRNGQTSQNQDTARTANTCSYVGSHNQVLQS